MSLVAVETAPRFPRTKADSVLARYTPLPCTAGMTSGIALAGSAKKSSRTIDHRRDLLFSLASLRDCSTISCTTASSRLSNPAFAKRPRSSFVSMSSNARTPVSLAHGVLTSCRSTNCRQHCNTWLSGIVKLVLVRQDSRMDLKQRLSRVSRRPNTSFYGIVIETTDDEQVLWTGPTNFASILIVDSGSSRVVCFLGPLAGVYPVVTRHGRGSASAGASRGGPAAKSCLEMTLFDQGIGR